VHFNLSLSEREGLDLMININSAPGSRKPRFIGVVRSTTILLACASPALGLVAEPGQACDARRSFSRAELLLKGPLDVPDNATHQYAIALTEFESADYGGSVETLKALQSQGQLEARSMNLLGVSYSKLGRYHEAYPILAEELKQNPSDLLAYLNLVTLFADTLNFTMAIEIANRAVLVFPQNSEVFVVRGAIHIQLAGFDKAHDDFESAIQLSPRGAEPRFLLALSDYDQRNFECAIVELKAAIQSGINDSDLHYLLAECMLRFNHDRSTDAIQELSRAIELNTWSFSARALRGRLLLEEGHANPAIADLEIACKTDPDSHSAMYSLARAYSAPGRKQEAKALFDQVRNQFASDLADQRKEELIYSLSQQKLSEALTGTASH
jgi:tetratricopeptide (TPR) repeat protein